MASKKPCVTIVIQTKGNRRKQKRLGAFVSSLNISITFPIHLGHSGGTAFTAQGWVTCDYVPTVQVWILEADGTTTDLPTAAPTLTGSGPYQWSAPFSGVSATGEGQYHTLKARASYTDPTSGYTYVASDEILFQVP
jgi:hypothetical protein